MTKQPTSKAGEMDWADEFEHDIAPYLRARMDGLESMVETDIKKAEDFIRTTINQAIAQERERIAEMPTPSQLEPYWDREKKLIDAGNALADKALYTTREYDGLHRLASAVAHWIDTVAKLHIITNNHEDHKE